MGFEDMVVDIVSGGVLLTVSVMLLTVRSYSELGNKPYQRIKYILATFGMLSVIWDVIAVIIMYFKADFSAFNFFIAWPISYIQLGITTIGLLLLVHSTRVTNKRILLLFSPMVVLLLIFIIAYCIQPGDMFSKEYYMKFFNAPATYTLYKFNDVLVWAEIVVCIYFLITEVIIYRRKLVNMFSGMEVIRGRKLTYVIYSFFGYFVLLVVGYFFEGLAWKVFFMSFNTLIFLIGAIVLFNIQDMYSCVMLIEVYMKQSNKSENGAGINAGDKNIGELLTAWESREDKSYLKQSLNLVEVAKDIDVHPSELSAYLNGVRKLNFNSWVNHIRTEEAVKLLTGKSEMTLEDVADTTGFQTVKLMNKVLKSVTGKDSEDYRKA